MGKNVVIIAGATATGKSSLAVKIAKELDGEIISADSMQIYKYMDIGSAKVTEDEKDGIVHHLIDIKEPTDEDFSVKDYVILAKEKINDILSRNRLPIVVGGTGLYISSLVDNIQFTESDCDEELRSALLQTAKEKGNQFVHDMLKEIDPEMAEKVHPNNIKRVIRAIEIYKTSGITLTQQNERSKLMPSPYDFIMLALSKNREKMYEDINLRVDKMIADGLIYEVKKLKSMGAKQNMQAMQGIGYKEVFDYLDEKISLDEMTELIKKNTRNYSKRQITWFKRDKRFLWLDAEDDGVVYDALYFIKNKLKS